MSLVEHVARILEIQGKRGQQSIKVKARHKDLALDLLLTHFVSHLSGRDVSKLPRSEILLKESKRDYESTTIKDSLHGNKNLALAVETYHQISKKKRTSNNILKQKAIYAPLRADLSWAAEFFLDQFQNAEVLNRVGQATSVSQLKWLLLTDSYLTQIKDNNRFHAVASFLSSDQPVTDKKAVHQNLVESIDFYDRSLRKIKQQRTELTTFIENNEVHTSAQKDAFETKLQQLEELSGLAETINETCFADDFARLVQVAKQKLEVYSFELADEIKSYEAKIRNAAEMVTSVDLLFLEQRDFRDDMTTRRQISADWEASLEQTKVLPEDTALHEHHNLLVGQFAQTANKLAKAQARGRKIIEKKFSQLQQKANSLSREKKQDTDLLSQLNIVAHDFQRDYHALDGALKIEDFVEENNSKVAAYHAKVEKVNDLLDDVKKLPLKLKVDNVLDADYLRLESSVSAQLQDIENNFQDIYIDDFLADTASLVREEVALVKAKAIANSLRGTKELEAVLETYRARIQDIQTGAISRDLRDATGQFQRQLPFFAHFAPELEAQAKDAIDAHEKKQKEYELQFNQRKKSIEDLISNVCDHGLELDQTFADFDRDQAQGYHERIQHFERRYQDMEKWLIDEDLQLAMRSALDQIASLKTGFWTRIQEKGRMILQTWNETVSTIQHLGKETKQELDKFLAGEKRVSFLVETIETYLLFDPTSSIKTILDQAPQVARNAKARQEHYQKILERNTETLNTAQDILNRVGPQLRANLRTGKRAYQAQALAFAELSPVFRAAQIHYVDEGIRDHPIFKTAKALASAYTNYRQGTFNEYQKWLDQKILAMRDVKPQTKQQVEAYQKEDTYVQEILDFWLITGTSGKAKQIAEYHQKLSEPDLQDKVSAYYRSRTALRTSYALLAQERSTWLITMKDKLSKMPQEVKDHVNLEEKDIETFVRAVEEVQAVFEEARTYRTFAHDQGLKSEIRSFERGFVSYCTYVSGRLSALQDSVDENIKQAQAKLEEIEQKATWYAPGFFSSMSPKSVIKKMTKIDEKLAVLDEFKESLQAYQR